MSDEAIPIRNLQQDLLRWCMVVPFYCGMLLTSILALKPGEKYTITLYDFWEAWGSNMVGKSPDDHEWQFQGYLTEKPPRNSGVVPAPRKTAPMSLVIVLRNSSPLGTLLIERFYPEPLRISGFMLGSIFLMIAGGCHEIPEKNNNRSKRFN